MLSLAGRNPHPGLLLAPMMDLTGRAFRQLIRQAGGCGLFYSEMLNSRRLLQDNFSEPIYSGFGQEPDLMLQLVGHDPACLAAGVARLEPFNPAGYDLNLGCTRAKIMKHGWGAAMLRAPGAVAAALRAMRNATRRFLTVKIRTLWENETRAAEFLGMLEDQGADAVIIHPRGVERQRYGRRPAWEWLAFAVQRLKIPVIANGDLQTPEQALAVMAATGCAGVMLGRAAAARPCLFREIAAAARGQAADPSWTAAETLRRFLELIGPELRPGQPALNPAQASRWQKKRAAELKTFCQFFSEGLAVPHWFWAPLQSVEDGPELARRALAFFKKDSKCQGV